MDPLCSSFSCLCCAHRWDTLQRHRGRCYIEAEVNRVVKAMFLTFADDVEISDKLEELITGKVDTLWPTSP